MRMNRWEEPTSTSRTTSTTRNKPTNGRATTGTSTSGKKTRTSKSGFGDNPPVRLEITYADGSMDVFAGPQIDADNEVIAALVNIRTTRRFWRLNMPDIRPGEAVYSTDEELVKTANNLGYRTSDPVEVGRILNCVAEYYVTGDDGEPALDDRGNWIPASPTVRGTYMPGSHYTPGRYTPPYAPYYPSAPAAAPAPAPAAAPDSTT